VPYNECGRTNVLTVSLPRTSSRPFQRILKVRNGSIPVVSANGNLRQDNTGSGREIVACPKLE
jgi:hypothetical protein